MSTVFIRSLHRTATRLGTYSEPVQQGMPAGKWLSIMGGVCVMLGGGAMAVAYRNDDNHSHIRQIFRNERGISGAKPHL